MAIFDREKKGLGGLDKKIEQLVKIAQAGDNDAFGQIYDLLVDKVYKYLFFKVGDSEAMDLTENVFLKVWENLSRYSPRMGASFSSWVFRIAHNQAVDYLKRRKENLPLEIDLQDHKEEVDPRFAVEQKISESNLRSALARLKPNYREVLTLSYLNDFSNEEVARIMKKNETALRVLKHRALGELKGILKDSKFNKNY